MAEILERYTALTSSSPSSDVSKVLDCLVQAPPSKLNGPSRAGLIKEIVTDLKSYPNSRLQGRDAAKALLAVKILGRDPAGSEVISENMSVFLQFQSTLQADYSACSEALRCLANAMLLIESARGRFFDPVVDGPQVCVPMLDKSQRVDEIFILSRILFLATASESPLILNLVEMKFEEKHIIDIISTKMDFLLVEIQSRVPMANEAMADLLKFALHVSVHYPKIAEDASSSFLADAWNSQLERLFDSIAQVFLALTDVMPLPIAAPLSQTIHALVLVPVAPAAILASLVDKALPLLDRTLARYFPGKTEADDDSVIDCVRRESPEDTLDDLVSPLALLIGRICLDPSARARVRECIVPDNLNRSSPLQERADLLGRCLRLLTSVHHERLRVAVGEMLFAMADSNASTLSGLVGYGNVAGFLFHKNIMSAPPTSESTAPTTTPKGEAIDPITGMTVQPKTSTTEDMTEEEKAREAEKLMVLFDRLEKTGALPKEQNPIRKAFQEGKIPTS